MAENLKTTKFKDDTDIPLVTDGAGWYTLSTPTYCWYNYDQATKKEPYGAFYNWYAVNTFNLCQIGWHVPSDAEWNELTDFLGGEGVAGGKLKETGTTHWLKPNTDATNETGFTAVAGGRTFDKNGFAAIDSSGFWWSSTDRNTSWASSRMMYFEDGGVRSVNTYKGHGLSVRCLKD